MPLVAEPAKSATLLREWPGDRILFFADERETIRACPQAVAITLGPRILRAATAAAVALWMAVAGDW